MDAKKLSQTLNGPELASPAAEPPFSCPEQCTPTRCRPGCGLEVTDSLLAEGVLAPEEADKLLDLRRLVQCRRDAEGALRLFCELRRKLEGQHYLAFYRMRRWLENQIVAEVRNPPEAAPVQIRLRIDYFCSEAVRRLCLCEILKQGGTLNQPQLSFVFLPLPASPAAAGLSAPKAVSHTP